MSLRSFKDRVLTSKFRRIKAFSDPFLSVGWSKQQDGMKAGLGQEKGGASKQFLGNLIWQLNGQSLSSGRGALWGL